MKTFYSKLGTFKAHQWTHENFPEIIRHYTLQGFSVGTNKKEELLIQGFASENMPHCAIPLNSYFALHSDPVNGSYFLEWEENFFDDTFRELHGLSSRLTERALKAAKRALETTQNPDADKGAIKADLLKVTAILTEVLMELTENLQ